MAIEVSHQEAGVEKGWGVEVSPLQQEEAGKAQGAKRSVWPWHGSISQDWEAKVEARPGVDGVVERQDRQVASYLSAKQAPWVRIPLLPQNLA